MPDDLTPTPEDYAVDPREILTVGCRDSTYAALLALARRLIAAEAMVSQLREALEQALPLLERAVGAHQSAANYLPQLEDAVWVARDALRAESAGRSEGKEGLAPPS